MQARITGSRRAGGPAVVWMTETRMRGLSVVVKRAASRLAGMLVVLAVAITFASPAAADSAVDGGAPEGGPTTNGELAAQHELQRLFSQVDKIDDESVHLEKHRTHVLAYLAQKKDAKPAGDVEPKKAALQKASEALPLGVVSPDKCNELQRLYFNLQTAASGRVIGSSPRPPSFSASSDPNTSMLQQIYGELGYPPTHSSPDGIFSADCEKGYVMSKDEKAKLSEAAAKVVEAVADQRKADSDYWQKVVDRLQEEIGARKLDKAAKSARIRGLEADLKALNVEAKKTEQNKTDVTNNLVEQVILPLIGAVVGLFILLLMFGRSIQAHIIDRRTLVEIIGIAFLLITILTLGATDRMDRAIVGTLLGSIASYIFGQQIAQKVSESGAPKSGSEHQRERDPHVERSRDVDADSRPSAQSPTAPPSSHADGASSSGSEPAQSVAVLAALGVLGLFLAYVGHSDLSGQHRIRGIVVLVFAVALSCYVLVNALRRRAVAALPKSGQLELGGATPEMLMRGDIVRLTARCGGTRTLERSFLKWFSSAENVVSVDDGVAVVVGPGRARITAVYGAATGERWFDVEDMELDLNTPSPLIRGDVVLLQATARFVASGKTLSLAHGVVYTSSRADVIAIQGSAAHALGVGTVVVTARHLDRTATRELVVVGVDRVEVVLPPSVSVGKTVNLQAVAYLSDGGSAEIRDAEWSLLDAIEAKLDGASLTCGRPGGYRVLAKWRGVSSPATTVTVKA